MTPEYVYSPSAFAEANFAEHATGYRAVRQPDVASGDADKPWVLVYRGTILRFTDGELATSEQWTPLHPSPREA